jgi:hypothetical protein
MPAFAFRHVEKTKSELYLESLAFLNGRTCQLLDDKRLISQLAGLERRSGRQGKDSVDHGPGGHDDVANAACGALCIAKPDEWYAPSSTTARLAPRSRAIPLADYR